MAESRERGTPSNCSLVIAAKTKGLSYPRYCRKSIISCILSGPSSPSSFFSCWCCDDDDGGGNGGRLFRGGCLVSVLVFVVVSELLLLLLLLVVWAWVVVVVVLVFVVSVVNTLDIFTIIESKNDFGLLLEVDGGVILAD